MKVYDNQFAYPNNAVGEGICWLELWSDKPRQALALVTELNSNTGTSITNAAERIASCVIDRWSLDAKELIWIEHYPPRPGGIEETWDQVSFRILALPRRIGYYTSGRRQRSEYRVHVELPQWVHLERDSRLWNELIGGLEGRRQWLH